MVELQIMIEPRVASVRSYQVLKDQVCLYMTMVFYKHANVAKVPSERLQ